MVAATLFIGDIDGIQVYENTENDLTTATTKLLPLTSTTMQTESADYQDDRKLIVATTMMVMATDGNVTEPSIPAVVTENDPSTNVGPVQYPQMNVSTTTATAPRTEKILKAYQIK